LDSGTAGPADQSAFVKTWFGEFESAVEEQWHLTLVMHPEVIGRGYRMLALRELLNRYAERATTSPTASSPTPWLLPLPRRPDRAVVCDDRGPCT